MWLVLMLSAIDIALRLSQLQRMSPTNITFAFVIMGGKDIAGFTTAGVVTGEVLAHITIVAI